MNKNKLGGKNSSMPELPSFLALSLALVMVNNSPYLKGFLNNYVSNTFNSKSQSKLEITREMTPNKTAGVLFLNNDKMTFRTLDYLLNDDEFETIVKNGYTEENDITSEIDEEKDVYKSRGSGTCVEYRNKHFIMTNYHVIEALSNFRVWRMLNNRDLDVSLFPLLELEKHSIDNLEDCLNLERIDFDLNGTKYFFTGLGRDLYLSTGKIQKDYLGFGEELDELTLSYFDGSLNPYDTSFSNNFKGLSGSSLIRKKDNKLLGVLHSGKSYSKQDVINGMERIEKFPMNNTTIYFTPVNDIIDWLEIEAKDNHYRLRDN